MYTSGEARSSGRIYGFSNSISDNSCSRFPLISNKRPYYSRPCSRPYSLLEDYACHGYPPRRVARLRLFFTSFWTTTRSGKKRITFVKLLDQQFQIRLSLIALMRPITISREQWTITTQNFLALPLTPFPWTKKILHPLEPLHLSPPNS